MEIREISENNNGKYITRNEIKHALIKPNKWESAGIDTIPNFQLVTFSAIHTNIVKLFSKMMLGPTTKPEQFSQGFTYLLPKTNDIETPQNYRTITSLSTAYKLLTSLLTERTCSHLKEHNICHIEQKVVARTQLAAKISCL